MATYRDVDTYYDLPDALDYQIRVVIDDVETTTGNNVRVRMWVIRGSGTGRYSLTTPLSWSIASSSKTTATGSTTYDFRGTSQGYALLIADETFTYTIAQGSYLTITVRTKASMSTNNLGPFDQSNTFTILPLYVAPPTPSYTVTYSNANGSNGTTTETVVSGNTGTFPNPGTRANYTFNKWDGSYDSGTATPTITADTTYTAYWTALQWTTTYNGNGGTAGATSEAVNRGSGITLSSASRTGYSFNGWYTASSGGSYVGGSGTFYTPTADVTLYAQWTLLAPGFTDESVTNTLYINQNINSTDNSSVSATNTSSYSIQHISGLNPTSWLSINNSGQLSGSTTETGSYTFRVAATSASGTTTYSNNITINVVYPGKRINSSFGQAQFSTAKRWDGTQWIALTQMKRWNGSSWINISN